MFVSYLQTYMCIAYNLPVSPLSKDIAPWNSIISMEDLSWLAENINMVYN
jgi:hypothetical protein